MGHMAQDAWHRLTLMYILCDNTLETLVKVFYHLDILDKSNVGLRSLQMIRRINPVAKALAMSRRKTSTQVVPDKKKYNRKKDKHDANQNRKDESTKD